MLIYFSPSGSVTPAIAKQIPLERYAEKQVESGPNGQGGILMGSAESGRSHAELRYDKGKQTWQQCHGSELWVGFWNDKKPTPEQLQKPKQLDGPELQLCDGQRWKVPILRRYLDSGEGVAVLPCESVPQTIRQDPESGKFVYGQVLPEYQDIWMAGHQFAEEWLHALVDDEATDPSSLELAFKLLGVNYQACTSAVSVMELLTADLANEIVIEALQLRRYVELLSKKKQDSALATSDS